MKKYLFTILLTIASCLVVNQAHASTYTYYRAITVTSTASVASGTNANFPFLFSGTYPWLESSSTGGGAGRIQNLVTAPNGGTEPADLIFVTSTPTASGSAWNCGTSLNFETESYSSSTGAINDWVNVPSLAANTTLYACYGSSVTTSDQSHPSSTWNSGYQAVYHLAAPAGTLQANDSTNKNNSTVLTNTATVAMGYIGGGASFSGSSVINITSTVLTSGGNESIEAWVYPTTASAYQGIGSITYSPGLGYGGIVFGLAPTTTQLFTEASGYNTQTSTISTPWSTNAWNDLVVTAVGTARSFYLNGNLVATSTNYSPSFIAGANITIGAYGMSSYKLTGTIDEFRLSTTTFVPSWILTEYNNQSNPATFYTIGSEQAFTVPTVTSPTATAVETSSAMLGANVTGNGGAALSAVGICWGLTSSTVTNTCSAEALNTATGTYSMGITSLPTGTLIYYEGYAQNGVGIGYSSYATTTTVSIPTVTAISPVSGANTGSVSIASVSGTNFVASTTVSLTMTGQSAISCTGFSFTNSTTLSTGSCPITNAAHGAWNVVVTNPDTGNGTLAAAFTVTAVPGAPTIGAVTAGNATATVAFSAPASDGSSTILYYTVSDGVGQSASGTTSPITITGLTNGTSYIFTVTATNAVGTGPASASSSPVTPYTIPTVISPTSAAVGTSTATLGANVTSTGGNGLTQVGICWGLTSSTVTNTCSIEAGNTATGTYSMGITSLPPGTLIYYEGYAVNTAGTAYSSYSTFTTTATTVPTVTSPTATSVGTSTATLGANVTGNGNVSLSSVGICWGLTSSTVTNTCSAEAGNTATGTYSMGITSLPTGTLIYYEGYAVNIVGTGYSSYATTTTEVPATAYTLTGPSSGLLAATSSVFTVTPDFYYSGTVTITPSGGGLSVPIVLTFTNSNTPQTFTITPSATGTVTLTPTNSGSLSNPSALSYSVYTIPSAPTGLTASPGNTEATLTWNAPADTGNSPITNYFIYYEATSTWSQVGLPTSTATSETVTGLTNGTSYNFEVYAVNAAGVSASPSNVASTTPDIVPGAPGTPVATGGNGQASISFAAPSPNGGSPILFYTVSDGVGQSATGTTSPIIVTGLVNGVSYSFTVTASNEMGAGTPSASSNSVTPEVPATAYTLTGPSSGLLAATSSVFTVTPDFYYSGTVTITPSGGGLSVPIVLTFTNSNTPQTFTITPSATGTVTLTPTNSGSLSNPSALSYSVYTIPSAPTGLTASPGNTEATLTWNAPADTGNSPITNYFIYYEATSTWSQVGLPTSTATSATVTGLQNGTSYNFEVYAVNAAGVSASPSNVASTTPDIVPGAPGTPVATGGNGQASISFAAPSPNGGSPILFYTVSDGVGQSATGTTSPIIVTGLVNGVSYSFTVTASNEMGAGTPSASSNSVTPEVPATAYTLTGPSSGLLAATSSVFTVTPDFYYSGTVTITPSGGGLSVPIVLTFTNSNTPQTFTITPSATGTVTLTPTNSGSLSNPSALSYSVYTIPSAPTGLTASPGNTEATLTWNAPADTGNSPITNYFIYYEATSTWSQVGLPTSTATSETVTGLTNGTSYNFEVYAVNAAGVSASPSNVASTTPDIVPGAPGTPVATGGNGQASISFAAPSPNGGSPILFYTVSDGVGQSATGTTSPIIVTGLVNGVSYSFTVTASNEMGAGTPSASSNSVTPEVPATAYTLTGPSSGLLAATSSVFTVTPDFYYSGTVTITPSGGGLSVPIVLTFTNSNTPQTFTITPSATGTVTLTPTNSGSLSNPSALSYSVYTIPSAPTGLTASPGNTEATLTWNAPADTGNSPITNYFIYYEATSTWSQVGLPTSTATSETVTGLTNGTSYNFEVYAVNAAGVSASPSNVASTTPDIVPGAPGTPVATGGNGQASISFAAPSPNGGSPILFYTVSDGVGQSATGTTSPIIVTGLVNGVSYSFTVTASNEMGAGTPSASSNSVTPEVPATAYTLTGPSSGLLAATSSVFTVTPDFYYSGTVTITPSGGGLSVPIVLTFTNSNTPQTFTITPSATGTVTLTPTNSGSLSNPSALSYSVYTIPSAPTGLTASPGNTEATLTWNAPADTGNSPITNYFIYYEATSTWSQVGLPTSTATSETVTGLTNGTSYNFEVYAVNAAGVSASPSNVASTTPATIPDPPTLLAAIASSTQVALSWIAPANDGGSIITQYVVNYKLDASSTFSLYATTGGSQTTSTVTGLTNGSLYDFEVLAQNNFGTSTPSNIVSSTPITVPDAPTIGTATASSTQATVSFSAPASDGGSLILYYTVSDGVGDSATGTTSPITVTGLTNGDTYSFTVTATNAAGTGTASASSNSVTLPTVPGAPTNLAATPGDAQVALSWIAPASDGGSAITDYVIDYKLSSTSTWSVFSDGTSTSTTATVIGLTNGSSYDFQVAASNVIGQGSASGIVSSIPITVPDAPTIGTATASSTQATVTFSAPASDGGSLILYYTVSDGVGDSATGTTSPITVTGLTNGTSYSFTVTATNAAGTGAASASSNSVTPATVPDAPTAVSATPSSTKVTLSWSAPAFSGGAPITNYVVEYELTIGGTWSVFSNNTSTATSTTVTGLTNGLSYNFRVSAVNAAGQGSPSNVVSSTPITTPDAPTSVVATRGDAKATITFTAPASDGGSAITNYTVTSDPGSYTSTGTSSPITVTGLTNGTPYTFTVTATNAAGVGPASTSSNSVTPATVPDAPTIGTATESSTQATVTFSAPANDGGSLILYYTVSDGVGDSATGTTSPITVTGLTNGTSYNFTVTATNDVGAGSASAASNSVTPVTVPGVPTIGTTTVGNAQATISFTAPASDGGSPITNYTVTSNPGGFTGTGTSSPITVTGLTNGTSYTFTVTATNVVGKGASSGVSSSTTPITAPDPPTGLTPTAGVAQVSLSWTAPVNDGGSVVTDYVIEYKPTASSTWSVFSDGVSANTNGIVTGLTNGTSYDFRVSAVNAAGQGSASASASAVPVTAPGAPTIGAAMAGGSQAIVSFTAPASDGGSPITGYTVTSNPGGFTGAGTSSPITVAGLTNGTSYTFTVTATNAVGTSASSSVSNSVTPATVPGAPTAVSAVAGNAQATISFTAPASDGGSPITGYTVTDNTGTFTGNGTSSPITVTGLTNGTSYFFTVTATNAVGTSASSSPSNSVTLSTLPGPPVNVAATVEQASIGLTWSAPVLTGGSPITDYVVEYELTTGGTWSIFADGSTTSTTATVTGLSDHTSYDFRVSAVTAIGQGSPSAIVTASPGEPAQVLIESFPSLIVPNIDTAAHITNEGSVDYEYQYTWCVTVSAGVPCNNNSDVFSGTNAKNIQAGQSFDIVLTSTVPTAGNYWFTLIALYGSTSSTATQSFTAVATYPGTPTAVAATPGNAQATISFTAPASDGGSPITGYTVTSNPGGFTGTGSASPIIVAGLTNGTSYTFTVTATNAAGTSPASTSTNAVTPATVPDPPTAISALAGSGEVTLSWFAPSFDGGSPITNYVVEYKLSSNSNWAVFATPVSTTTTAIVTGLTNGISYDFEVSAVNAIGQSVVNSTSANLPPNTPVPPNNPPPNNPPNNNNGGGGGGGGGGGNGGGGGSNYYFISSSASAGGSINPSGSPTITYGSSRTFAIIPTAGYQIAEVFVNNNPVGAIPTYTFSNVTGNNTISAVFMPTGAPTAIITTPPGQTTPPNQGVPSKTPPTGAPTGTSPVATSTVPPPVTNISGNQVSSTPIATGTRSTSPTVTVERGGEWIFWTLLILLIILILGGLLLFIILRRRDREKQKKKFPNKTTWQ